MKLLDVIIGIGVLIIIILIAVLIIDQMDERFRYDCEKQNNIGTIEYWDAEINCEAYIEGINAQLIKKGEQK